MGAEGAKQSKSAVLGPGGQMNVGALFSGLLVDLIRCAPCPILNHVIFTLDIKHTAIKTSLPSIRRAPFLVIKIFHKNKII